jgi:hypothetical protein
MSNVVFSSSEMSGQPTKAAENARSIRGSLARSQFRDDQVSMSVWRACARAVVSERRI